MVTAECEETDTTKSRAEYFRSWRRVHMQNVVKRARNQGKSELAARLIAAFATMAGADLSADAAAQIVRNISSEKVANS